MARVGAVSKQKPQVLRFAQDDGREGLSAQDDIRKALGEAFLLNDRVNQLLLENLDAEAWRAKPPVLAPGGGVRTIAAIFSHMHNIRRKWLRLTLPHGLEPVSQLNQKKGTGRPGTRASRKELTRAGSPGFGSAFELPEELNRMRCTQKQTAAALKESAQLCAEMLADTRMKQFVRDGWAKPWNVDDASGAVQMLAYMVSHEAHHRGQVCMLAHQMGYRLPMKVMSRMWAWESSF